MPPSGDSLASAPSISLLASSVPQQHATATLVYDTPASTQAEVQLVADTLLSPDECDALQFLGAAPDGSEVVHDEEDPADEDYRPEVEEKKEKKVPKTRRKVGTTSILPHCALLALSLPGCFHLARAYPRFTDRVAS